MKIYKQDQIDELANILKNGGVISVPTDTVYGICMCINSESAYDKLAKIKKRPSNKSIAVMCANEAQIKSLGIVDKKIEKLIHAFMPGPITLVLNKKENIFINNKGLEDTNEFAVRMAPTKIIEQLIYKAGSPIFMTSANLSGQPVCTSVDEIEKTFFMIDAIMEGYIKFGIASTIVDCTKEEITIQREGPITIDQIMQVLK